ncbi:pyridoxamine 5'-phosphate oxidase family protein [Paenibacillus piri]|uniref:Pyridoxamine 5'-phosphate oxidase family protein n=1 Tax=Paenibacillus piri TaxID=2547395 RepID=A0A4R5KF36_9BACL|nr:pyridoxamine 5'-phosphate oxidase family protein [Paenibacillus piri]TDF93218.1 pyridoxamine 5'-phosphate oxidase family protein [Paenibacillus piri]
MFDERIHSWEQLESLGLFGKPSKLAANKVMRELDSYSQDFIAKSPFLVISTADAEGRCDVSPRGDAPGFVHVIDERHLFIPDRPGNRRMDSARNILTNPQIGLLFIVPGLGETFRVNGQACVTRDRRLLELSAVNGNMPLLGIGVQVEECFLHCAKAFKRSGLWEPETWPDEERRPSAPRMLVAHVKAKMAVTEDEVKELLHESYTKRLY